MERSEQDRRMPEAGDGYDVERARYLEAEERASLLERVRSERDAAEQRAEQAERIVGALVRKYGEQVRKDHAWRVGLTELELMDAMEPGATLRVMLDPVSGAMLIRYELPL